MAFVLYCVLCLVYYLFYNYYKNICLFICILQLFILYLYGNSKTNDMKNGRINERNIGSHKLDGGAKRAKAVVEPVLTEEQYKAKEAVRLCNMILKEGVRLYEYQITQDYEQRAKLQKTTKPAIKYSWC